MRVSSTLLRARYVTRSSYRTPQYIKPQQFKPLSVRNPGNTRLQAHTYQLLAQCHLKTNTTVCSAMAVYTTLAHVRTLRRPGQGAKKKKQHSRKPRRKPPISNVDMRYIDEEDLAEEERIKNHPGRLTLQTKNLDEKVLVISLEGKKEEGLFVLSEVLAVAQRDELEVMRMASADLETGAPGVVRFYDHVPLTKQEMNKKKDALLNGKLREGVWGPDGFRSKIKEIQLSDRIAEHDVQVKVMKARKLIMKLYKVNCALIFKVSEEFDEKIGEQLLRNFVERLTDIATLTGIRFEKRRHQKIMYIRALPKVDALKKLMAEVEAEERENEEAEDVKEEEEDEEDEEADII